MVLILKGAVQVNHKYNFNFFVVTVEKLHMKLSMYFI